MQKWIIKKAWYLFLVNKWNISPTILFTLLTCPGPFPFTVHSPHLFEGRGKKKRWKISPPPFFCLEIIIAFRRDIGEGTSKNRILFHAWSRKALDNSGTNEFWAFILAITKVFPSIKMLLNLPCRQQTGKGSIKVVTCGVPELE